MEDSIQKILEYLAIGIIGFCANYIRGMRKSLDAAHDKIRELQLKVRDGS